MADVSLTADCTSIDNWYEVLDHPRNPAIVRSQGNRIAPLALAVISWPENRQLVITSGKPSCACLDSHRKFLGEGYKNQIYLC